MTLSEYQTLTGVTVPTSKQTLYTAKIAQAQTVLETMLGYTLNPDNVSTNLYNETGKTAIECARPSATSESGLTAADAVSGAYRVFDFDPRDEYFHVDPLCAVYNVKLIKDNVTYKTFDSYEYRVQYKSAANISDYSGEWSNMIENCLSQVQRNSCADCFQLAVDAEWLWEESSDIPTDLLYVQAELATYYAEGKEDIKSQTLGSHSYTRFDKSPEAKLRNSAVVKKYAGPFGAASKVYTV